MGGINLNFKLHNLIINQLAYLQNCFNFENVRYQCLVAKLKVVARVALVL